MSAAPVGLDGEQAIRDALAAGPTPGPWMVPHFARDEVKCNCGYVFSEFQHGMGSICEVNHGAEDEPVEIAKANARLIAACHPETMRALLAELDRLRSASRQEGWKLVPVEPTKEMIDAAMHVKRVRLLEVVTQIRAGVDEAEARTPAVIAEWAAMLAAAPHQAQEAQGDRHGE